MTPLVVRIRTGAYKAAATHLLFSLLSLVVIALLVFKVWYSAPLSTAMGMFAIFAIVCIVNIVSGPLLTLIIYNKHKKSLLFDLIIIIIIQLGAFFYGIFSLAQARPVWLTFYNNRFEIVRVNDIEQSYLKDAKVEYSAFSLTGPKWVAAKTSGTKEEIENLEFANVLGAKIAHQPAFYYPIEEAYLEIKAKAYDLSELKNANNEVNINRYLIANPKASAWLPLWGQEQHMVVFLDKEGRPLTIVDLRPWTKSQLNKAVTTVMTAV